MTRLTPYSFPSPFASSTFPPTSSTFRHPFSFLPLLTFCLLYSTSNPQSFSLLPLYLTSHGRLLPLPHLRLPLPSYLSLHSTFTPSHNTLFLFHLLSYKLRFSWFPSYFILFFISLRSFLNALTPLLSIFPWLFFISPIVFYYFLSISRHVPSIFHRPVPFLSTLYPILLSIHHLYPTTVARGQQCHLQKFNDGFVLA